MKVPFLLFFFYVCFSQRTFRLQQDVRTNTNVAWVVGKKGEKERKKCVDCETI